MMKMKLKKAISMILCLILMIGLYPVNTYAADTNIKYTLDSNVVRTDKVLSKEYTNMYTYTMPEDGAVSFTFTPDMLQLASTNGSWNVKLRDINYNVLEEYNYLDESIKTKSYNFVKGSVFYISVDSAGYKKESVGIDYSIVANYQTLSNWEMEDLITTSNIIKTTTLSNKNATHGSMYSSKDEDVFLYQIPANGPTKFLFEIPEYNEKAIGNYGWEITFSDADNQKIYSAKVKTRYTSQILNFKKGTTLRVTVKPYISSSAPVGVEYTLMPQTTSSKGWEVEGNNSFAKATKITSKMKGTLYKTNDSDYYVYKATGSKCQVKLTSDDSIEKIDNGWRVRVYDKDKKMIKDFYTYSQSSVTFKTKKKQKYYIVVTQGSLSTPVDAVYTLTCKKK